MRVLICGNCTWKDAEPIFSTMNQYVKESPDGLVFISGMAPGADAIAYYLSFALDAECDKYAWNEGGLEKIKKIMGEDYDEHSRNQWMLDSGVDICHAFAHDLTKGSGTQDMVNRCIGRGGIPVFWTDDDGNMRFVTKEVHKETDVTKEMELV